MQSDHSLADRQAHHPPASHIQPFLTHALCTLFGPAAAAPPQSVVTYIATGPTTNGKSPLANCQANTKKGWVSGSTAAKEIKKATDSWCVNNCCIECAECIIG